MEAKNVTLAEKQRFALFLKQILKDTVSNFVVDQVDNYLTIQRTRGSEKLTSKECRKIEKVLDVRFKRELKLNTDTNGAIKIILTEANLAILREIIPAPVAEKVEVITAGNGDGKVFTGVKPAAEKVVALVKQSVPAYLNDELYLAIMANENPWRLHAWLFSLAITRKITEVLEEQKMTQTYWAQFYKLSASKLSAAKEGGFLFDLEPEIWEVMAKDLKIDWAILPGLKEDYSLGDAQAQLRLIFNDGNNKTFAGGIAEARSKSSDPLGVNSTMNFHLISVFKQMTFDKIVKEEQSEGDLFFNPIIEYAMSKPEIREILQQKMVKKERAPRNSNLKFAGIVVKSEEGERLDTNEDLVKILSGAPTDPTKMEEYFKMLFKTATVLNASGAPSNNLRAFLNQGAPAPGEFILITISLLWTEVQASLPKTKTCDRLVKQFENSQDDSELFEILEILIDEHTPAELREGFHKKLLFLKK